MSLRLYMDVHVPRPITAGLLARGVDVLTAQADGATRLSDPDLLDRATALGRVLVTQDEDLLAEGAERQRTGRHFAGVFYAHQEHGIGVLVMNLELLAKLTEPDEWFSRVQILPLR